MLNLHAKSNNKTNFMRKSLLFLFAAIVAATSVNAQSPDYFVPYQKTTLRLPSVPLLVNDPYFSFWSPYDNLNDGTTKHWDNQQKSMDGLLRVDGNLVDNLLLINHKAGQVGKRFKLVGNAVVDKNLPRIAVCHQHVSAAFKSDSQSVVLRIG